MHHILRTYIPATAFESRTRDLLDYCRRTGCREVLLFTTSYDEAPECSRTRPTPAFEQRWDP